MPVLASILEVSKLTEQSHMDLVFGSGDAEMSILTASSRVLLDVLNVITSPSWGARSHVSQEEILYSQL